MSGSAEIWQFTTRRASQRLGTQLLWLLLAVGLVVQPALAQTDTLTQVDLLEKKAQALSLEHEAYRLSEKGQYPEAVSKAKEALTLWEQALGPDHIIVGSTLEWIALHLIVIKNYGAAKPLLQRALRIREDVQGAEDPALLRTLDNLGLILSATDDHLAARPLHERALLIREKTLGPDHPDVAKSLDSLALTLLATGDYANARGLYERRLVILEKLHGPNHPDVADGLVKLAGAMHRIGEYSGARSLYERALATRERALGPDHPDVADTLVLLSALFRTTGNYVEARPLIDRALRVEEKAFGPSDPRLGRTLNYLANLLQDTGNYEEARALYERALGILEQSGTPANLEVAHTLNNLAEFYRLTGDYTVARSLFERALRMDEQVLGPNHPIVATTLNNLAQLLSQAGNSAAALPLLQRALRIRENSYGPSHPDVAESLNNLALVLKDTEGYTEARPLLERALKIWEQSLGSTHPHVATGLNNLATNLEASGDYTAAQPLLEQALRIQAHSLGIDHPNVATSLNNLANLVERTGDYARASLLYERALRVAEAKLGPTHPFTALVLANFATIEWKAGRPRDAVPKLARAVMISRKHTARGLVGLSNREKLSFLKTTEAFTDAFLSLPPQLVTTADAYHATLDRKNVLFRALAGDRALLEASSDTKVAALLEEYTAVRRRLASLAVHFAGSGNPPDDQTLIASLYSRLDALEAGLSRASAVFRQNLAEVTAGAVEVCASVPRDAVLIDLFWYLRYSPFHALGSVPSSPPHYVAFIIRGGDCERPIRVDLGPAAAIDKDVRRLREALSREALDPGGRELRARYRKTLATRLKAKLFPPEVQAAIAKKPRLIISLDGALALLPFGLLPGEDGHEFLLETRTISYLQSGRDLIRTAPFPSAPAGLLALGAPTFDRAPVQVAQATTYRAGCGTLEEPFAPLPGTGTEVRAITGVYQQTNPTGRVTALEGTQATKAEFLEQVSKAGVIHLATHAYFSGEDCTPAGLVPDRLRIGVEQATFLGHNPLLLAGIALAGANEREKADGILTALEVTTLDLRGTNLVVLSACDTGLGTAARSHEVLGLRWAFAYAGARNLVTSLWSVPDAETATLMTHFYTALWEKGLSVPTALRAAQLEMLRDARAKGDSAPHTWGAFVASGPPN